MSPPRFLLLLWLPLLAVTALPLHSEQEPTEEAESQPCFLPHTLGFSSVNGNPYSPLDLPVKIHISMRCTDRAVHLHVQRMDSPTEGIDTPLTWKLFDADLIWNTIKGWPVDLQVDIPALNKAIPIPANPEKDVLEITVPIDGDAKIQWTPAYQGPLPLRIHQIFTKAEKFEDAPLVLQTCMNTVMRDNPEFQHHYYGDKQAQQLIEQLEGPRVRQAFDSLVAGAFKADLFRYVLLHHYGGVYMDAKLITHVPLREILPQSANLAGALVKERFGWDGIVNGFIAVRPGDKLMRLAIDKATDNVHEKHYGQNPLYVTGPMMLGECFAKLTEAEKAGYVMLQFEESGRVITTSDRRIAVIVHNAEYRRVVTSPHLTDHYDQLWARRQLFGEK